MRPQIRILYILQKLGELWSYKSDLRFGQLIYHLSYDKTKDIFLPEDDQWLTWIEEEIEKEITRKNKK